MTLTKVMLRHSRTILLLGTILLLFHFLGAPKRMDTNARKLDGEQPGTREALNVKGEVRMATDNKTSRRNRAYLPELLEGLKALKRSELTTLPLSDSMKGGNLRQSVPEEVGVGRLMIFLKTQKEGQGAEELVHFDDFEGKEWLALFEDVLHCPTDVELYQPGDDLDELDQRIKLSFQAAIPEYPLLGRIWDTYIDIFYEAEEVRELRDECLKVCLLASSNEVALRGLRKLINASDEALSRDGTLVLACD